MVPVSFGDLLFPYVEGHVRRDGPVGPICATAAIELSAGLVTDPLHEVCETEDLGVSGKGGGLLASRPVVVAHRSGYPDDEPDGRPAAVQQLGQVLAGEVGRKEVLRPHRATGTYRRAITEELPIVLAEVADGEADAGDAVTFQRLALREHADKRLVIAVVQGLDIGPEAGDDAGARHLGSAAEGVEERARAVGALARPVEATATHAHPSDVGDDTAHDLPDDLEAAVLEASLAADAEKARLGGVLFGSPGDPRLGRRGQPPAVPLALGVGRRLLLSSEFGTLSPTNAPLALPSSSKEAELELDEVMRSTAAIRSFTKEPVSDEVLAEILEVARFAPSGGNRQPWRVVVVKDASLRRQIAECYSLGWREYVAHLQAGLVPFAPGADGTWQQPAVDLDEARRQPAPNEFADELEGVPVMLVLFAHLPSLAVLDNGLERQSIVGGGSVYPFSHNILLAARDRGLGGVMTTVLCREEPRVKELFGAGDELALAGLVALGHPVHQPTRLRRRSVEEFTTLDHLAGTPFRP
jgi:nitroreductase